MLGALYERLFHSSVENVNKRKVKKLKDNNNLKSNAANPHHKLVSLSDISRNCFAFLLGRKFNKDEIVTNSEEKHTTKIFQINTIHRLLQFFSADTLIKIHPSIDTSIIVPWFSLKKMKVVNFENLSASVQFEEGRMVIPVKEENNRVYAFVPCDGLNEDNEVEFWVKDFLLESFGMTVGPEIYHKEKGDGLMSICQKNYDWAYIPRNQNIVDNDYIKVRINYYQILGWCNDSFQPIC